MTLGRENRRERTNQGSHDEVEPAQREIEGEEVRHIVAEIRLYSTVTGLALVPWSPLPERHFLPSALPSLPYRPSLLCLASLQSTRCPLAPRRGKDEGLDRVFNIPIPNSLSIIQVAQIKFYSSSFFFGRVTVLRPDRSHTHTHIYVYMYKNIN